MWIWAGAEFRNGFGTDGCGACLTDARMIFSNGVDWMTAKTVEDSRLTMALLMLPEHANPVGNVHGGEIMKLMDSAAGAAARRYARSNVVTARASARCRPGCACHNLRWPA